MSENVTWETCTVRDVIERHFCGPSPDCEERQVFAPEEWGVLKTTAITWAGWNEAAHKVLPKAFWEQPQIEVHEGDVLVTKAGPRHRVGVVCHVPSTRSQLVVSGKMIGLRPKPEVIDARFLAGVLGTKEPQKYIHDRTTGMAESQVNFANEVLLDAPLRLPPVHEQHLIAKVLDTLDTAIRETEALIDKLKAVKQGLLHDLLTRGIDANGQLRPPQTEAPQLYKESPLGWIPREWEILPLEDVADLQVGFAFKSEWFLDTGKTRLLRGDNVGYGFPEWETVKYLSDEAAHRFADYLLKEGDVVIGMDRTFTKTGSKFSVINQDDLPCLLVQRVGRFMPRLCSMDFLRQLTLWPAFQRNLLAQQKGMDIPHLSKSEILSPLVPVPATYEQGAISERMASFEQRITSESSLMAKLKSQRSGLMDDLLTGRVRVTPLLEASS